MKIQEMKSGILHLNKKTEDQRRENYYVTTDAGETTIETDPGLPVAADCELDEPSWSVISFAQNEAGGLIYAKAAALLSELDARGVAGLCVVTNEAAERIRS